MQESVRQVVAQQALTVPVPIDTLIRQYRLKIVVAPMRPGLQSVLTLSTQPGLVLVNQAMGPWAQRFAIAHEAIHSQYHRSHLHGEEYSHHVYYAYLETEANAGAAELLLPYEWFADTARDLLGDRIHTAGDLAAFLASPEARRWAGQARVTVSVIGYHLYEVGLVPFRAKPPRLARV